MYKNASLYPELQHHACSHSQEKMCVSSPGPYHYGCSHHEGIIYMCPALNPYTMYVSIIRRHCVCPPVNLYTMYAPIIRRQLCVHS